MKWCSLVAGFLVAAILPASPAGADSTMGQLVYSFSYGSDQNTNARDSSTSAENPDASGLYSGGGSGASHYHGAQSDKGTMTVDVVRQQPDKGLVVDISEQGQNTRRAPPATCVAYGDTRVICDPNKTVYPEEYTLLRFLGPNFVDPNQLDANRHWALTQSGSKVTMKADYTIAANSGGIMQINENRSIRTGGSSQTTDVQTKIGYNFNLSVPTAVNEYVTQRDDNGVSGTTTTIYQTTLSLVSDSVTKIL
jgi:hypothetical protein